MSVQITIPLSKSLGDQVRQGSKVQENRFSPSAIMGLYLSGNHINSNQGELRYGAASSAGPGQTRPEDEDATKQ